MLIDFSSRPPTPEFELESRHLNNYRRVYEKSERAAAPADPEAALAEYLAAYDRVDAQHVVVKARDLETTFGSGISNEAVAEFCWRHGPRFIGFAGVDPHKGMTAVRELEHAVRELGLRGLNIQCFEHRITANDSRLYPLYAKCVELGIPVNVHTGINFSLHTDMAFGHPQNLDPVLRHFPELRVCASPPGWPWVSELIALAWRHRNLWIGVLAVRPKYLVTENSGYGMLLQFGQKLLKDRMVFGTSYPLLPVERTVEEIRALGLPGDVEQKWLYDNGADLLGL